MTPSASAPLIVAVADEVIAHADELTELDQAVGDGDHGINMKRGFEAVRADAERAQTAARCAQSHRHAARDEGRRRLRPALRDAVPGSEQGDRPGRLQTFCRVRQRRRGGQGPRQVAAGQKTMLDVLAPVQLALAEGGPGPAAPLPVVAAAAADATIPMLATRGRASFLGERSIGHMDPGARSSALIVAPCAALEATHERMSASSSSRIRPRSPRARPTWCVKWSATGQGRLLRRRSGRWARHRSASIREAIDERGR